MLKHESVRDFVSNWMTSIRQQMDFEPTEVWWEKLRRGCRA